MYPTALVSLALLLCSSQSVSGGKVLVFPVDGSHWINMKVIIEELHARGHEVTVLRPSDTWYIKPESPHYKSITINASTGFDEEHFGLFVTNMMNMGRGGGSLWNLIYLRYELLNAFQLMHQQLLQMVGDMFDNTKLMQSLRDAKYDVVLTDPAIGGGVLLGHRLGLPLVLNVRWTIQGEGHHAIAPSPVSYVPLPEAQLTDKMNFTQRVKNFLFYLYTRLQIWYVVDSSYRDFVHQHFGSDVHYMELFQSADIWLMRNDFTFEFPRPTMPNIIYMSGFQCKPSKPLSKELEDFVQSSGEHGVIVMTLGTLVAQLPEDITEDIAAAFAQLPQKVIWRHQGKRPSTLGNNTLLLDWLPQNDLLGHPKTRVFVAHGGTNGIQEAVYHGVPLVGLPLMFDQPDNFFRMKVRGVAKVLDLATVNKDNFLEALKEVLNEPSYSENMKKLSNLQRDQPIKPLDHAMFWIEFVMRHKGAPHLRTESYKMSTIQYYSIDVMAFLLAAHVTDGMSRSQSELEGRLDDMLSRIAMETQEIQELEQQLTDDALHDPQTVQSGTEDHEDMARERTRTLVQVKETPGIQIISEVRFCVFASERSWGRSPRSPELKRLLQELLVEQQALQQVKNKRTQSLQRLHKKRDELDGKQEELDRKQEELDRKQEELDRKQEELDRIQDAVDKRKEELDRKQQEVDGTRDQLAKVQDKVDRKREELAVLKQEVDSHRKEAESCLKNTEQQRAELQEALEADDASLGLRHKLQQLHSLT
ncbi:hypothetical protein F2P81_025148 [Scophthalmus maximus]|uniref:Uncharacterized protein n=1 Tax=Scophthalmus maximus TaxID=52904 RepID=A0A6A4RU23_SCOMX|nr:hypothetical protein F2P81_025148 [Scophthalmus maximus]